MTGQVNPGLNRAAQPGSNVTPATLANAAQAANALSPEAEQESVQRLAAELRCLVCQNQTIADSNASLAVDLRNTIKDQLRAGKDEQAIKQYMVERYGEFILYDPPFSAGNAALWIGPFLLLLAGVWITLRVIRRSKRSAQASAVRGDPPLPVDRLQRLEERYRHDTERTERVKPADRR